MRNRKGTHVGVVISFVMFITFLAFLNPLLVEPLINKESKRNVLDNLKTRIIENVSQDLSISSLNINNNKGSKCVSLQNFFTNTNFGLNVISKNSADTKQATYLNSNDLAIDRASSSDVFFRIYYSKEFPNLTANSGCATIPQNDYVTSSITNQKYASTAKIKDLINEYNSNYQAVKSGFGLLSGDEFGLSFQYSDQTKISTNESIISVNIYSNEIPVQYLDSNGNILLGTITVKVW